MLKYVGNVTRDISHTFEYKLGFPKSATVSVSAINVLSPERTVSAITLQYYNVTSGNIVLHLVTSLQNPYILSNINSDTVPVGITADSSVITDCDTNGLGK